MNRRGFLKATAVVPVVAVLPSIAVAKAEEKKTVTGKDVKPGKKQEKKEKK